jgi:uncharacterized protein with NRDE domain
MCTLVIYLKTAVDYPVVIAANRDEFLDRPACNPTTLLDNPHVIGGQDLRAGGTWLGINEFGLIVGLLNRRAENGANPVARSRGLLTLDALKRRTAAEAAAYAASERAADYNPFNLLIASRDEAFVAYNRVGAEAIEIVPLRAGMHLLSNLDVNDLECPKICASHAKFATLGEDPEFRREPLGNRERLGALLADHNTQLDPRSGRPNALCLHLGEYGTRSSSLIFVGSKLGEVHHFFAPGPPCATPYAEAEVPRPHASK